jgi:hypothetical protein
MGPVWGSHHGPRAADARQRMFGRGRWFVVCGLQIGGPATLDALPVNAISVFPPLDAPTQFKLVLYCSTLVLSK